MYEALLERESQGRPIRVALLGAGSMGLGIAWQLARTPGFRLVTVTDINLDSAVSAAGSVKRGIVKKTLAAGSVTRTAINQA